MGPTQETPWSSQRSAIRFIGYVWYGAMAHHSEKICHAHAADNRDTLRSAIYMTESLVEIEENPNFLGRLTETDYQVVIQYAHRRSYEVGGYVFRQGEEHDGIHVVESGRVRTFYVSPSGREITLAYWTPGHFVGGPEIFGGGHHMWSSVAVDRCIALWLPGSDLKTLILKIPDLAMGLIQGLVHKGKCYSALLQLMATRPMGHLLAHLLLTLEERYGNEMETGTIIRQRFTHGQLASMIGATRQWVSSTLDKFEAAGLISRDGEHIVVIDRRGLLERSF